MTRTRDGPAGAQEAGDAGGARARRGSSCSSSAATTRRRSRRSQRPPASRRGRSSPTSRARKTSSSRRSSGCAARSRSALAERPAGVDALTALREFILSSAAPEERSSTAGSAESITADPTLASHQRARIGQLQEVLAAAIADDLGVGPRRPAAAGRRRLADSRVRGARAGMHRGLSTAPTPDEIAAAIDPVISFVRAGLEAGTNPPRRPPRPA